MFSRGRSTSNTTLTHTVSPIILSFTTLLFTVQTNIEKLQKAYKDNAKPQTRMDSFFTVKPSIPNPKLAAKRKAEKAAAAKASKKKGKGAKKR